MTLAKPRPSEAKHPQMPAMHWLGGACSRESLGVGEVGGSGTGVGQWDKCGAMFSPGVRLWDRYGAVGELWGCGTGEGLWVIGPCFPQVWRCGTGLGQWDRYGVVAMVVGPCFPQVWGCGL